MHNNFQQAALLVAFWHLGRVWVAVWLCWLWQADAVGNGRALYSLQINVVKGSSFYGVCKCGFKKTLPAFTGSNPSPASIKNNPDLFASDFVFT